MSLVTVIPFLAFLFFLVLQVVLPRRNLGGVIQYRQLHNVLLFAVNTLLMRVVIPASLVSVALWAQSQTVGLFNLLDLPITLVVLICVVILDFAIYWQHVATHQFPILWRIHKVHHADHEMDVTTAIRFHPVELILSLGYKSIWVLALGAPVSAVIVFELLLFLGPVFNHSNVRISSSLDRVLRWVIATPDVHRAHHSTNINEQNTNYGFFLIWWDKLFRTYTHSPENGQQNMTIGLKSPEDQCGRVDQMLVIPFRIK